jgi:hypothetical protein
MTTSAGYIPTITTALRVLVTLYRKKGKYELADRLTQYQAKIKRNVTIQYFIY